MAIAPVLLTWIRAYRGRRSAEPEQAGVTLERVGPAARGSSEVEPDVPELAA